MEQNNNHIKTVSSTQPLLQNTKLSTNLLNNLVICSFSSRFGDKKESLKRLEFDPGNPSQKMAAAKGANSQMIQLFKLSFVLKNKEFQAKSKFLLI